MAKIKYAQISKEEAAALYGAWLMDRLPEKGVFLGAGPFYYALENWESPAEAVPVNVADAGGRAVLSSVDPEKTSFAIRCFREWRRLPAGVLVASTGSGYIVCSADMWRATETETLDFLGVLTEVATDKEIAAAYGKTAKAVQKDCGEGIFGAEEARKEGTTWLITKAAAAHVYEGKSSETSAISPLLLVYTTAYAGELWGRSAEEVRSAAAGAGHRAARLGEGERRRAGRTWLVTRDAMETLYGNPVPGKWRELIRN